MKSHMVINVTTISVFVELFNSVQFNSIYVAPNHNKSHLNVLYIVT